VCNTIIQINVHFRDNEFRDNETIEKSDVGIKKVDCIFSVENDQTYIRYVQYVTKT
jgi:hypothetical protein